MHSAHKPQIIIGFDEKTVQILIEYVPTYYQVPHS